MFRRSRVQRTSLDVVRDVASETEGQENLMQSVLLLLGAENCGKSTLVKRLCQGIYQERYEPTTSLDLFARTIQMVDGQYNDIVQFKIWDSSGDPRFQPEVQAYYDNTNVLIFTYDVTNPDSVQSLHELYNDYKENSNGRKQLMYLFGMKSDLPSMVTANQVDYFIQSGMKHFLITSKNFGDHEKDVFRQIAKDIIGAQAGKTGSKSKKRTSCCQNE